MEQMIDYLRDNTIFARHSRAETRLFLERLEADGKQIVDKLPPATEPIVEPHD